MYVSYRPWEPTEEKRTHGDPVTQGQSNALRFTPYPYMSSDGAALRSLNAEVRQCILACIPCQQTHILD